MTFGRDDRSQTDSDARRSRLGIAAFMTLTLALGLGVFATFDLAERQNPFAPAAYQN